MALFRVSLLSSLLVMVLTLSGLHSPPRQSQELPYMWSRSHDGRFGTYLKPHGSEVYDDRIHSFEHAKVPSDLYIAALSPEGAILKEMLIRGAVPTPQDLTGAYSTELQTEWSPNNKRLIYRYRNQNEQEFIGFVTLDTFNVVEHRLVPRFVWIRHPEEKAILESTSWDGTYVALYQNQLVSYYRLDEMNVAIVPRERTNQGLQIEGGNCFYKWNAEYGVCTHWGPVDYNVAIVVSINNAKYLKILNLDGKQSTQTFLLRHDPEIQQYQDLYWSPKGYYVVVATIPKDNHTAYTTIDAFDIEGHHYQGIYERALSESNGYITPVIGWCGPDILTFVDVVTKRFVRYNLPKGTYQYTLTAYKPYTGEDNEVYPDPCK